MSGTFTIKRGDSSPSLGYKLSPATNLVGASVVFNMNPAGEGGPAKIERSPAIVDNASEGIVRYDFSSSDTTNPGTAYAEFEVTYADGTVETFTNSGYIAVVIPKDFY